VVLRAIQWLIASWATGFIARIADIVQAIMRKSRRRLRNGTMAKKRDKCHAEIRQSLRDASIVVYDTGSLGSGFVDMVACREDGRVFMIEAKAIDGVITTDEYEYIVRLVNPAYRIFRNAENTVKAILEK
jgi:hypothetical protein